MSRRIRGLAAGALGVLSLAAALWWFSPLFFRAAGRMSGDALYRMPGADSAVALTVDDAPTPSGTREILGVLEEHGARATFFLVGSRAARRPALVEEVIRAGHGLGHHMWRDERSLGLDSAAFERRLERTDSVLDRFGGSRWLRPGGGLYSPTMRRTARRHGYRIVLGDVYPFDPAVRWPALAASMILAWAEPGSIIILHDGEGRAARTAEVLRRILPALERRGLEVVALGELVERWGDGDGAGGRRRRPPAPRGPGDLTAIPDGRRARGAPRRRRAGPAAPRRPRPGRRPGGDRPPAARSCTGPGGPPAP